LRDAPLSAISSMREHRYGSVVLTFPCQMFREMPDMRFFDLPRRKYKRELCHSILVSRGGKFSFSADDDETVRELPESRAGSLPWLRWPYPLNATSDEWPHCEWVLHGNLHLTSPQHEPIRVSFVQHKVECCIKRMRYELCTDCRDRVTPASAKQAARDRLAADVALPLRALWQRLVPEADPRALKSMS